MPLQKLDVQFARILAALDKKGWVKCPFCRQEWTKLRPCTFIKDGHEAQMAVCVDCCESVRRIHKVMTYMGLDLNEFEIRRETAISSLPRKYWYPKCWKATIRSISPIVEVLIMSDDPRIFFMNLQTKAVIRFDNMFQAVSYLKFLVNDAKKKMIHTTKLKDRWLED